MSREWLFPNEVLGQKKKKKKKKKTGDNRTGSSKKKKKGSTYTGGSKKGGSTKAGQIKKNSGGGGVGKKKKFDFGRNTGTKGKLGWKQRITGEIKGKDQEGAAVNGVKEEKKHRKKMPRARGRGQLINGLRGKKGTKKKKNSSKRNQREILGIEKGG